MNSKTIKIQMTYLNGSIYNSAISLDTKECVRPPKYLKDRENSIFLRTKVCSNEDSFDKDPIACYQQIDVVPLAVVELPGLAVKLVR